MRDRSSSSGVAVTGGGENGTAALRARWRLDHTLYISVLYCVLAYTLLTANTPHRPLSVSSRAAVVLLHSLQWPTTTHNEQNGVVVSTRDRVEW